MYLEYSFIYDCWFSPAFCGAIEQHFVVHTEKFKKRKKTHCIAITQFESILKHNIFIKNMSQLFCDDYLVLLIVSNKVHHKILIIRKIFITYLNMWYVYIWSLNNITKAQ